MASIIIPIVTLLTPCLIAGFGVDYYNADFNSDLVPLIGSEEAEGLPEWCYLDPSCDESSPTSAWQGGTCKFGQRQSPINIRTDNLTPAPSKPGKRRRKKRRLIVKRRKPRKTNFFTLDGPSSIRPLGPKPEGSHRPWGGGWGEGGYYYKPRPYPKLDEDYEDYWRSGMPAGPYVGQRILEGYERGTPIKHVELPSTVEQGLLCSREPHWNLMWVNRWPWRYWIRMHLCRLMLHQKAEFLKLPKAKEDEKEEEDKPEPEPKEVTVPLLRSRYSDPEDDDEFLGSNFQFRRSLESKLKILNPDETESILQKIGPPPVKLDFSGSRGNYAMKEFQILNNGRTLEISRFVSESGTEPGFKWDEQGNGVYRLEKVVFHWGPTDDIGSEHTVDGRGYAAEMQLVHYRTTRGDEGFPDFRTATESGQPNAVAVIAVFLDVREDLEEDSFLGEHLEEFRRVSGNGDRLKVESGERLRLDKVLENVTEAYQYMGSFTTPDCKEVVAWLVVKEPVPIQKKDILALRESLVEGGEPLIRNFRSVQNNSQPVTLIGIKQ